MPTIFEKFPMSSHEGYGGWVKFQYPQTTGRKTKKVHRLEIWAGFRRRQSEQSPSQAVFLWIAPLQCSLFALIYTCIRTKNIDDVTVVPRSRKSVRRFIKLFLGINDTPYWFHQTLTFKDCHTDAAKAKIYLNRLFDLLRKKFPEMPALYVEERQKRFGLHYHVIFMMFGSQPLTPEETRQSLARAIFPRWNTINGGTLNQTANMLKLRTKHRGLWYLLKGVTLSDEKTDGEHWNGVSRSKVIEANSHRVSKQDVREEWNWHFKLPKVLNSKPAPVPAKKHQTKRNIDGMKAYLEWTGAAMDLDALKRSITGRKGKVSNEDFLKPHNRQDSAPDPDTL